MATAVTTVAVPSFPVVARARQSAAERHPSSPRSAGLKEPEPGATALPTLLMSLFITDEDQDLNSMQVEIYFDEDVDGAVSTQEVIYPPVTIPLSQDTCLDAEATVNIDVFVNGVSPRYNQAYEWGVLVRDANNDASELYVFECITPFENGDAGNGEG